MDFHSLSRKDLQTLCKKNKIPANITSVAMADALSALPQVEGLDEFLNPTEAEAGAGTPETTHRMTTTRRKTLREEPQSAKVKSSQRPQRKTRGGNGEEGLAEQETKDANVVPITPAARRRATAVSTRRSKKDAEVVEDDEEKKVDHGKPTNVTETPAAVPRSRTRATGHSICPKTNGTSARRGYNTRRSVRLLEKKLSKMSLDAEDLGLGKSDDVSEEMSISQQIEDSADTEEACDAGISLQTVSNVVLEETDGGEVSSLEKKSESECQAEIDVGAEVEAEPQEEDSSLKADIVSDVDINNIQVESAQADNNKAGSELSSESVEASQDASVEFAEQDVAALIVEVADGATVEVFDQNEASSLLLSPVSDDSAQLKEVLEVDGKNNEAEHLNVADDNNMRHFESMKDADDKAEDEKDLASPDGTFENSDESLSEDEEVDSAPDVIGASSVTASEEDNAKAISEDSIDVIDVCVESCADKSTNVENITLESPLLYNLQEESEGKSEHLEESMGEVENGSASEITMALENDAGSEKSVGVLEAFTESLADVTNATLESSMVDVGAEEKKDNLEIEEQPQESNEQAAEETSAVVVQPVVAEQSKGTANETVPKMISVEEKMQNANMKENLSTNELHKKSIRELKMMLKKLSLDGKSNCKSKTDNKSVVKEVEKKRTALQALPENQMARGAASSE